MHAAEAEDNIGALRPDLPFYTLTEVSKHKTRESRVWVTFKHGVYDITEYVQQHPGGSKILLAAGGRMEPFWNMYAFHKHPSIAGIAEDFRIGNIEEEHHDTDGRDLGGDPFINDPGRSGILTFHSEKPFNAEPPSVLLVDSFITSNDLFYVRNHLPVPVINPDCYSLQVVGSSGEKSFSLDDLKNQFKKVSVTAVVQCAGNRRNQMSDRKPVKGLNWGVSAIGNAKWSGVSFSDLLDNCCIDLDSTDKKHIVFEGSDVGPSQTVYGASIPIELARMLKGDIVLAYEMNGVEIPRDHGYPVRVIIPGVVGARQVKWLKRIYLSDDESDSHWQRRDYKGFNSSVDWHNVDFESSESIMQLPVVSAICDPVEGAELEPGADEINVRGYAWSGGGRSVIRVDISADGGKTWRTAAIAPNGQSQYRSWSWSLWETTVPIAAKDSGKVELVCKAVDVAYNVQPDGVDGVWNLRGVLNNAWHRVKVFIPPD